MKRFLASLAVATVALSPMAWLSTNTAKADAQSSFVYSCAQHAAAGYASCFAIRRAGGPHDSAALGTPAASVPGFHPADLQSAYNLTAASASNGGSQTVAIVDAYDDPTAESDLAVYRSTFGLPACTTANGCFKKVNQYGGTTYPRGDTGWAGEISLDLDMVSAICPNCHILLVEASSNSNYNLGVAVYTAAKLGANAISNSYGGSEASSDSLYDKYFYNHPGIAMTASTGDSGYGAQYPASSPYVTAVGGTSLYKTSQVARGWYEAAWSCYGSFSCSFNGGTGSGCSAYSAKPTWQGDTGCSKRSAADVSAVADPNTGVAVYQTYGGSGWAVYGGTSVSSPIIASVYALAGNASSLNYASSLYSSPAGSLNDVTVGTNAVPPSCSYGNYLCTAKAGYDGPTGNGTPNGLAAF